MCLADLQMNESAVQLCDYKQLAEQLQAEARLTPISRVWAIALMQRAADVLLIEHARRVNDPNVPTWEN